MAHNNLIFTALLRRMLNFAVPRVLAQSFSTGEIQQVVSGAMRNYGELAKDLPTEETLGARVMVRLASATIGLYQALMELDLTKEEAMDITSRANWLIYEKLTGTPWKLTALLARNRLARVRRSMDLFMRFPYASPGYSMNYVEAEPDAVAFDVHRCPAAEYFARNELSELCLIAFCNLDYPLADVWKVTLDRTQTLAEGAAYCNFRFRR